MGHQDFLIEIGWGVGLGFGATILGFTLMWALG
jgi:hypothetical protein